MTPKRFLLIAAILASAASFSQTRSVTLTFNSLTSKKKQVNREEAIKAIAISNTILNSQEFRDSVAKYSFTCENYGEECSGPRIPGTTVLDSLYKNDTFSLDLIMRRCMHEYGHSLEDQHTIWSCYRKLRNDDTLPFSIIYAYHICHEYMHIVGFYHTDHIDDIAEKVGMIAYRIAKRWYNEGKLNVINK